ncbi:MAG: transposase, partial [bacterium]|nr:transposase [bacterium]
ERNLFELKHPDFAGERLIACRNAELAHKRATKRDSLLKATVKELDKVRGMVLRGRLSGEKEIGARLRALLKKYRIGKYFKVDIRDDGFNYKVNEEALIADTTAKGKGNQELIEKRLKRSRGHIESIAKQLAKLRQKIDQGQLHGQDNIGVRVGKVIDKYKVGKHFKLDIRDNDLSFEINREQVKEEAALDGIYIVRTSLSKQRMDADETVRSYKLLSQAERAFRSFKTVDLMVRPIHHRLEDRVRAHIFLCMLAYYVQWHMMEAWRPLLYADEDQNLKALRDPVAAAKRSNSAMKKVSTKRLDDGSRVYAFQGLLD